LERPVQAVTLLSALNSALRSRQRQYQVRDHLQQRERVAVDLERLVQERTEALREEIAERERIADELRHAQKMEAIGQLTGGVAHDFNNLLMVISGGLTMLERRPERRLEIMDAMKKATARGTSLTHQLLAFSRRQPLKPEAIDLISYFKQLADLLDRTLRGDVEVSTELAPDIWPVNADPGELQLAIMNLAVNARDAMPKGGRIRITASNAPADCDNPAGGPDMVCISVIDQGSGMTPEVLNKVFEPFFTTKEVGKGSGLGLAQVHGYVTQSGGKVKISSVVDRGTTVSIYLPRSTEVAANGSSQSVPLQLDEEPKGHVLVVEDDEAVASLVTEMIRELNYRVTHVPSASAALEALREGPIDIVFSDVMMPGDMDGLQLSREVKARHPGVPVLLTSGYAEMIRRTTSLAGVRILAKPFELHELAAALEHLKRNPPSSILH
jgi:signal transduction histidine kinase/CheY-like chemotaxis protein